MGGASGWFTIGRHGSPWTPDTAREEARRLLGDVARRQDPAAAKKAIRNALTVSELCHAYLSDAEKGRVLTRRRLAKKASTLVFDRGRIERHIEPLLGRLAVECGRETEIDRLVRTGFLEHGSRFDKVSVLKAFYIFLDRTLGA